jgi:hypothetical protein
VNDALLSLIELAEKCARPSTGSSSEPEEWVSR